MSKLYKRIAELESRQQTCCIVTVVDSSGETPRKAGARGIVFPDGLIEGTVGGGSIEVEAIETAQEVMKQGRPLLKTYPLKDVKDGMMCGGQMALYFEPVLPAQQLHIFGGGHVGRQIAHAGIIAGWQVVVIDHRPEVLQADAFPAQATLLAKDYLEYISATTFTQNDWIAIVTPKHQYDQDVLEQLLGEKVAYLGMMGSRRKVREVLANLKSKGHPDTVLDDVCAPIGLNIAKETPGEIAISIIAEMLAVRSNVDHIQKCSRKSK